MSRPPVRRPLSLDPRSLRQRAELVFIALFIAACLAGAVILYRVIQERGLDHFIPPAHGAARFDHTTFVPFIHDQHTILGGSYYECFEDGSGILYDTDGAPIRRWSNQDPPSVNPCYKPGLED